MALTFPKSVRLTNSSEFLRVKAEGRSHGGRLFSLGVLKGAGASRVGIITSRRVGGAVERNRVRRRLREILRATRPSWNTGYWVVVIARRAAVDATFDQLRDEWLRLGRRSGILTDPTRELNRVAKPDSNRPPNAPDSGEIAGKPTATGDISATADPRPLEE